MFEVVLCLSIIFVGVAFIWLASEVRKVHQVHTAQCRRLVDEQANLRDEMRELRKLTRILSMMGEASEPFAFSLETEPLYYDAWRHERIERAHAEFMERTSVHLPCDRSTESIARYMGAPID